jgi:hypothetical protein
MFSCKQCINYDVCVEVCPALSQFLDKEQSQEGYSPRHIRRVEIPFSPEQIEYRQVQIFNKKYGRKPLKDDDKCPSL